MNPCFFELKLLEIRVGCAGVTVVAGRVNKFEAPPCERVCDRAVCVCVGGGGGGGGGGGERERERSMAFFAPPSPYRREQGATLTDVRT